MTKAALPPHAYIPGQTARHAEGAFDGIRATARPGMSDEALADCPAFQTGLHYMNNGFYWEAHELLEPVWMACPPNAVSRSVVQGLIQLANAQLKRKMGKPNAAARLYGIARKHLTVGEGAIILGISTAEVIAQIDSEIMEL